MEDLGPCFMSVVVVFRGEEKTARARSITLTVSQRLDKLDYTTLNALPFS